MVDLAPLVAVGVGNLVSPVGMVHLAPSKGVVDPDPPVGVATSSQIWPGVGGGYLSLTHTDERMSDRFCIRTVNMLISELHRQSAGSLTLFT